MRRSGCRARSLLGCVLLVAACSGGGGGGQSGDGPYIRVTVLSADADVASLLGFLDHVQVCRDSSCRSRITTATVLVNGEPLAWNQDRHEYVGSVEIPLGQRVTTEVTVDGRTYTGTGTQFSSVPVLSGPAEGATWDIGPHTISWTGGAPTSNASYFASVLNEYGRTVFPRFENGPREVDTGTLSLGVPANGLTTGSYHVLVGIGTKGLIQGGSRGISIAGAGSGSGMWLAAVAPLRLVTVSGLPPAPSVVTAVAGNGENGIEWAPVEGATSYSVYWSTSAGVTKTGGTRIFCGESSHCIHGGLTNGTAYHYVVTAESDEGESPESAEVTATPSPAPFIQAQILSAPLGAPTGVRLQTVRTCTDYRCVSPISTATVTVNGTALAYDDAEPSGFHGNMAIPLGATVTVEVTIGANTYTATGVQFTSVPAVSAPQAHDVWNRREDHTVSWSGGTPTTSAGYLVGILDEEGKSVFPLDHDGPGEYSIATHSLAVPANAAQWFEEPTLHPGEDQVMVAIGTPGLMDGHTGGIAFSGTTAQRSGLWFAATGPTIPVTVYDPPSIHAWVKTMTDEGASLGSLEQVYLSHHDFNFWSNIEDAVVQVNGETIPWDAGRSSYVGMVPIALGEVVTIDVTVDGRTYTATATQFTTAPEVTAPSSAASWNSWESHDISWTSAAPGEDAAYLAGVLDASGEWMSVAEVFGSSLHLGDDVLEAGTGNVAVAIIDPGFYLGNDEWAHAFSGADPDSTMWLAAFGPLVPVTVH